MCCKRVCVCRPSDLVPGQCVAVYAIADSQARRETATMTTTTAAKKGRKEERGRVRERMAEGVKGMSAATTDTDGVRRWRCMSHLLFFVQSCNLPNKAHAFVRELQADRIRRSVPSECMWGDRASATLPRLSLTLSRSFSLYVLPASSSPAETVSRVLPRAVMPRPFSFSLLLSFPSLHFLFLFPCSPFRLHCVPFPLARPTHSLRAAHCLVIRETNKATSLSASCRETLILRTTRRRQQRWHQHRRQRWQQ